MDGIHDLGGMQGFGPVAVEADEPTFHNDWEGRVIVLMATVMGQVPGGGPAFRHSIERMDPAHYLDSSYYEHWLTGVATLAVEEGLVTREELETRAGGRFPLSRPLLVTAADVDTTPPAPTPRFAVGDGVRVRDLRFGGHTRCPGYLRGRRGEIARVDDAHPVPEIEGHCRQRVLETTYGVGFAATELWGDDADPTARVHVDLYERYLEGAEST